MLSAALRFGVRFPVPKWGPKTGSRTGPESRNHLPQVRTATDTHIHPQTATSSHITARVTTNSLEEPRASTYRHAQLALPRTATNSLEQPLCVLLRALLVLWPGFFRRFPGPSTRALKKNLSKLRSSLEPRGPPLQGRRRGAVTIEILSNPS